jgi:hypothetical protein
MVYPFIHVIRCTKPNRENWNAPKTRSYTELQRLWAIIKRIDCANKCDPKNRISGSLINPIFPKNRISWAV